MKWTGIHSVFKSKWHIYKNYVLWGIADKHPPGKWKNWWLRRMGVDMGKDVFVSPGAIIDPIFPEYIHIGDNVFLGWNARIFSHVITPYTDRAFSKFLDMQNNGKLKKLNVVLSDDGVHKLILAAGEIWIEDGAFVGGFSTIRAGVRVGEDATIGSDSLVTKDVPDFWTVVGIPAKERR